MPSRPESPRSMLIRSVLLIALLLTWNLWSPWFVRGATFVGEAFARQLLSGLPKTTPARTQPLPRK